MILYFSLKQIAIHSDVSKHDAIQLIGMKSWDMLPTEKKFQMDVSVNQNSESPKVE